MGRPNRRKHQRVRAQGVATHLRASAGTTLDACLVEDISAGGLFARCDRKLAVGSPVALTLVRSGMKKALQLMGTVVGFREAAEGRGPSGLRIAFNPLPKETMTRLSHLLRELGANDVAPALPAVPVVPDYAASARAAPHGARAPPESADPRGSIAATISTLPGPARRSAATASSAPDEPPLLKTQNADDAQPHPAVLNRLYAQGDTKLLIRLHELEEDLDNARRVIASLEEQLARAKEEVAKRDLVIAQFIRMRGK